MKYFKRNLNNACWMYYRFDGSFYDYWHATEWRHSLCSTSIPPLPMEEVSRLEILVALGARALKGETNED
jgi:hypothetical protein